jgi:NAD-dependent deacetylase
MATWEAFVHMPDEVWAWYLYRRAVCGRAEPNAAHRAIADLERAVGDRFILITQNVDGLHLKAGSSLSRTYQIHGNIDFMRCSRECTAEIREIPESVSRDWTRGRKVSDEERAKLVCPRCGEPARPHVLWFDESYDEPRFRIDSSVEAAWRASLLVVAGTSGATTLPNIIATTVARRGVPFVAVNDAPSPFTKLAEQSPRGWFARGTAGEWIPEICRRLSAVEP